MATLNEIKDFYYNNNLKQLVKDMMEDGNVLTLTSRYGKYETVNIVVGE